jgi:membrane associated rhomboid family serine protease
MSPTVLVVFIILSQMLFLLPIRDRRSRERGFPWMTVTIVAVNVLIHAWVTYTVYWAEPNPDQPAWAALYPFMEVPRLIVDGEGLGSLSVLTSFFLHASMSHLLGNMFVLWFFGRKVEDSTGPLRFLLFYMLCGFTASLTSVVARATLSPFNAEIPGLGASGAIAGVMGAYLFLYSEQRVLTLVSTWLAPVIPIPGLCFVPLPIPIWLPAWVFIIYRMLTDALLGQFILEMTKLQEAFSLGINVFAHLGGALGGLVFIYFFVHPEVLAGRR